MGPNTSHTYWRWVLVCTTGELLGFGGIPVLGGALTLWLTGGLPPAVQSIALYVIAAIGGLGEGAVLAWFQLRVLRRQLPLLDARRWTRNTALGASFAWMCGMLAPTLDELIGVSAGAQIAIWVPAGLLILFSIGTAQSWVLRELVDRPRRWIKANVLAWLLGLPWTFVLPALLPESAPMTVRLATFAVAGVLMGLTVGLVTGAVVVRLPTMKSR